MRMTDIAVAEMVPQSGRVRRQQKVAIMAQTGLLMECFAEILCGRFPDYDVVTYENPADIPADVVGSIRLTLIYCQDPSQIDQIVSQVRDGLAASAIGIIMNDLETAQPVLRQLMEKQRINGVLSLSLHLDVFLAGIELLAKGGEHFPSLLLQQSRPGRLQGYGARRLHAADTPEKEGVSRSRLTLREVEILDLVCKGTQNKNIAGTLKLSENTVKAHIRNIYKKMQVRNRTEAASQYFNGLTKYPQLALAC